MLRSMKDMEGYAIGTTDGVIGQVQELEADTHRHYGRGPYWSREAKHSTPGR